MARVSRVIEKKKSSWASGDKATQISHFQIYFKVFNKKCWQASLNAS